MSYEEVSEVLTPPEIRKIAQNSIDMSRHGYQPYRSKLHQNPFPLLTNRFDVIWVL